MKKYSFRLQTVLDLKEKILENKMLELSKVVSVYNQEKDRLQEFETKKKNSLAELNDLYSKPELLDLSQVKTYKAFLGKISFDINKQKQVLEKILKLMEAKQKEVNQALKEKKIYEKLKENEEEKFYKELNMKESVEIDDIALSRYGR